MRCDLFAETLKHQLTVPVLKFVLLLYIQHIHKISLRASLVSGSDEYPRNVLCEIICYCSFIISAQFFSVFVLCLVWLAADAYCIYLLHWSDQNLSYVETFWAEKINKIRCEHEIKFLISTELDTKKLF